MARLVQIGAELNSVTTGVEIDVFSGAGVTVVSTAGKVRSGTYAFKVAPSAASPSARANVRAPASGVLYYRTYVLFDSFPASGVVNLVGFLDSAATGTKRGSVAVTSTGTLRVLKTDQTQLGSDSAALSTGRWYRIEISTDQSTSPGTIAARFVDCGTTGVDPGGTGTSIATGNDSGQNTVGCVAFGLYTTSNSAVAYFDDIAVNDSSGTNQTTYPGSGRVLHLKPNATGDANSFLVNIGGTAGTGNNFTRVNEVPPDNATSYNASAVLNAEDLFNCDDSGIGSGDTVNTVCVGARFTDLVAADATAALKLEIEKASSATKTQSAAMVANSTSFVTNPGQVGASVYRLVTYLDPVNPWTQATLDSMQIGYLESVANVQAIAVTSVWASVDYTPTSFVSRLALMGFG